MGMTAENLAEKYNVSREDAEKFSLQSQRTLSITAGAIRFSEDFQAVIAVTNDTITLIGLCSRVIVHISEPLDHSQCKCGSMPSAGAPDTEFLNWTFCKRHSQKVAILIQLLTR